MTATPVTLDDLTTATLDGAGVFDTLMRSTRAHLEKEFTLNRIKGPEYAEVYLGSLQAVLQTAASFTLAQSKAAAELAQLEAQTALLEQQRLNAVTEGANLVKQGELLDKQALQAAAQTANLVAEGLNIPKQGEVLDAQKCELQAQFDLLVENKLKTTEEKTLLIWKTTTEKAQTLATGVDDNSVIGKQKTLYGAQADGFKRDAEQKVAKILVDSWNVRRTTDEGTVADATNKLDDATVGRAVAALLAGINA